MSETTWNLIVSQYSTGVTGTSSSLLLFLYATTSLLHVRVLRIVGQMITCFYVMGVITIVQWIIRNSRKRRRRVVFFNFFFFSFQGLCDVAWPVRKVQAIFVTVFLKVAYLLAYKIALAWAIYQPQFFLYDAAIYIDMHRYSYWRNV